MAAKAETDKTPASRPNSNSPLNNGKNHSHPMTKIFAGSMTSRLGRNFLAILLAATFTGSMIHQAEAITNGTEDGNTHPHVGLVVFFDAEGTPLWRCSGTLISPTVFLTAGHCAEGPAVRARVYFEPQVIRSEENYPFHNGVEGTVIANPDFADNFGQPGLHNPLVLHDVAGVILDEPVILDVYGLLPQEGLLNQLTGPANKNLVFDVVGYGVQDMRPEVQADLVRYAATSKRITEKNAVTGDIYLKLSSDPGKGNGSGGTCFGDSGGPTFLKGSNVIVGITSWGVDGNCAGPGYAYRVDIAESLNFIKLFLLVP